MKKIIFVSLCCICFIACAIPINEDSDTYLDQTYMKPEPIYEIDPYHPHR